MDRATTMPHSKRTIYLGQEDYAQVFKRKLSACKSEPFGKIAAWAKGKVSECVTEPLGKIASWAKGKVSELAAHMPQAKAKAAAKANDVDIASQVYISSEGKVISKGVYEDSATQNRIV